MFEDGLKYQDSYMSSTAEFIENLHSFTMTNNENNVKGGPVLYRNKDTAYVDSSDAHTLVVGDTGSMKTLRFVLPLIYTCGRAGESMVIVDPKGELARKTSSFLKEQGYKTVILNYRYPQKSPDSWNPMDRISKAYKQGGEERQNAILQLNDLLNDLFYTRPGGDKDIYWIESAGQVAFGICRFILAKKEELNMKNLLLWRYNGFNDGTLEGYINSLPESNEIYQSLIGYLTMSAENTKSCILSTFDQLVRIFNSSPALTEMMSETSFDISSIGKNKTAVFMIVPDEKTTFHFLATLFINQCYSLLLETAEKYEGSLPIKVNFILEEFCNLPKLSDLVPMLTAARSRNIRIHMIIQSYGQMVDKYSENVSKAILDNCGNLIYLHSREISFLEYISKLAGNNEYGRPLISISRLQRLKKNETLIFHDRCYPFLAQDIPLIFEYPIKLGKELPYVIRESISMPDDDYLFENLNLEDLDDSELSDKELEKAFDDLFNID